MKKSLIAFAALAAVGAASAQSSITLFGTVDVAAEATSTKTGTAAAVKNKTMSNNRQGTSQISVRGTEELGGGLKGIFLWEGDFDGTTGNNSATANASGNLATGHAAGFGGGEVYVGLAGAFGSVKLGSPNTPTLSTQGGRNPFGTKLGSGFGSNGANILGTGHVREDKSIRFDTASFGGASLALDVADGKKYDLGAFFKAGPADVGVTYFKQDANKLATLQAKFTMGPVALQGGYHKESGATNAQGMNIGGVYSLNNSLGLLFNVAKLNDKSAADADKTIVAIGPKYSLSARTSVYARYVSIKTNDSKSTAANDTKKDQTYLVGVQHNF